MISIGIIENNNILRQNLVQFFNGQQGMTCSLESNSAEHFFQKAPLDVRLHVVLQEFSGRSDAGARDLRQLKKTYPKTEVITFSHEEDTDSIVKAFYAGATGYLSKATSFVKIKEAIVDTCEGKSAISPMVARRLVEHFSPKKKTAVGATLAVALTPKESQLVQCLTDGLSYKLAADSLSVSTNTVSFHVRNLYKKLGVNSKSEVVALRLRGEC